MASQDTSIGLDIKYLKSIDSGFKIGEILQRHHISILDIVVKAIREVLSISVNNIVVIWTNFMQIISNGGRTETFISIHNHEITRRVCDLQSLTFLHNDQCVYIQFYHANGQTVVSLIVFICACVWGTWGGGGWVQFVSIAAFLVFAALFILKLSRIINKVPEVLPILFAEFAIYALWVIMYIISGFVAAVQGFHPPAAVSAFFSFACGLGFGVDAFIKFRDWREGGSTPRPQPTAETGTTPTDQARSTGQY